VINNKLLGPVSQVRHVAWTKNTNIYEVNVRQYTPEGTFNAFKMHLPRLKEMGVDILWLMPINPIGEKNRKGSLGSYYSVKNYVEVNPEFGNLEDFKNLVKEAHNLGMYVIIDWVANHTAWDNPWITEHPDWYDKDSAGRIYSPFGWSDVAKLDYEKQDLRKAMIESLSFWIRETDIDGFRCDVAGEVPTDFWDSARKSLDQIKPVFMLAEAEKNGLLINAFDMEYAWKLLSIDNKIAKGKMNSNDLEKYFAHLDSTFPIGAFKMNFITNHDENSWNGTAQKNYDEGLKAFAVLTATIPGMPLIYSGQEADYNHALLFFEKDPIVWGDYPIAGFYKTLLALKHRNPALWNGHEGGTFRRVHSTNDTAVFAFIREKQGKKVFVMLNFTDQAQQIKLSCTGFSGKYTDVFSGSEMKLPKKFERELKPWEYLVLEK
jgi:glycosidase